MSSPYVFEALDVAPVSEQYDVSIPGNPGIDGFTGPFFVSVQYWVHAADTDPGIGAFMARIHYVDPTGEERRVEENAIGLNDPIAIDQAGVAPIRRQSGSSLFRLVTELFGTAGTSRVSYIFTITPADSSCDLQTMAADLVP